MEPGCGRRGGRWRRGCELGGGVDVDEAGVVFRVDGDEPDGAIGGGDVEELIAGIRERAIHDAAEKNRPGLVWVQP